MTPATSLESMMLDDFELESAQNVDVPIGTDSSDGGIEDAKLYEFRIQHPIPALHSSFRWTRPTSNVSASSHSLTIRLLVIDADGNQ
jgi:hypothetical protein